MMVESVADISRDVRIVFNSAGEQAPAPVEFKYGWCKTDHKAGKAIRYDYRSKDYVLDEPYAAALKTTLENLGLPFPKEEEVFRGTHHDMLFLDSHGVVIRIGPLDVSDLLNPAIVQPLGWVENRKLMLNGNPFTVAIYPGVELYKNYARDGHAPEKSTNLNTFLEATGLSDDDSSSENKGVIRVWDEQKNREVGVKMLIDPDNDFLRMEWAFSKKRWDALEKHKSQEPTMGEAIAKTLANVFSAAKEAKWYQKAFEVHEPLRRLFWESFKGKEKDAAPDANCMKQFWNACARVTNNPASCVMPLWKTVEKDGEKQFIREEVYVPHVVLYRPWTGESADKIIRPIVLSTKEKEAIRKAYKTTFSTSIRGVCRKISAAVHDFWADF